VRQDSPSLFGKVDRMNEDYLNNPTRWESKRVAFDNEGTTYVSFSLYLDEFRLMKRTTLSTPPNMVS
jgi:hypothetical protein